MKNIIMIGSMILMSSSLRSQTIQTEDLEVHSNGIMDLFKVVDKILEITTVDDEDPVRISKARIVNSRATKRSRKEIKNIESDYQRGHLSFNTYVHLMSKELQISVSDFLEEQSLILAHSSSINRLHEKSPNNQKYP